MRKAYMDKVCDLLVVRTKIKDIAEKIANDDNYRVVRPYLDELVELAELEKKLRAEVVDAVLEDWNQN